MSAWDVHLVGKLRWLAKPVRGKGGTDERDIPCAFSLAPLWRFSHSALYEYWTQFGTQRCALLILRHTHSYRATRPGDVEFHVLEACQRGDTGEIR